MVESPNIAILGRRVRALRLARSLTLEEVVSRTMFTVSWLSKLENGQLTPSLDGLVKLAQALECDVGELVEGLAVPPRLVVDRHGTGTVAPHQRNGRSRRGVSAEMLAGRWRGRQMHPVILHLSGAVSTTQPDRPTESHDGERFLLVLQGEVTLHYGAERIALATGDSAYVDAAIPHTLVPAGQGATRVLSVSYQSAGTGRGTARGRRSGPRSPGRRSTKPHGPRPGRAGRT